MNRWRTYIYTQTHPAQLAKQKASRERLRKHQQEKHHAQQHHLNHT